MSQAMTQQKKGKPKFALVKLVTDNRPKALSNFGLIPIQLKKDIPGEYKKAYEGVVIFGGDQNTHCKTYILDPDKRELAEQGSRISTRAVDKFVSNFIGSSQKRCLAFGQ